MAWAHDKAGQKEGAYHGEFGSCDEAGEIIGVCFPALPVGSYLLEGEVPDGPHKVTVHPDLVTEVNKG